MSKKLTDPSITQVSLLNLRDEILDLNVKRNILDGNMLLFKINSCLFSGYPDNVTPEKKSLRAETLELAKKFLMEATKLEHERYNNMSIENYDDRSMVNKIAMLRLTGKKILDIVDEIKEDN